MSDSLDKKMLVGFSCEVKSYLPSIREGINHFQNDSSHHEALEDALRYIHTIKGASALMGLFSLSQIASYIEDLLEEVISGHINLDISHNQWLSLTIEQIDLYLECLLNGKGENQKIVELIESEFFKLKLNTKETKSIENKYIDRNNIEDYNTFASHSESYENLIPLQEANRIVDSNDESLLLSTIIDNNNISEDSCQKVFTVENYTSESKNQNKNISNVDKSNQKYDLDHKMIVKMDSSGLSHKNCKENYSELNDNTEKQYISDNKNTHFLSKINTDIVDDLNKYNNSDNDNTIVYCDDEHEVNNELNSEVILDEIVGKKNDKNKPNTLGEENNNSILESKGISKVSNYDNCNEILCKQSSIDLTSSEPGKVYSGKEFGSQNAHDIASQGHGIFDQDEERLYDLVENIDDIDDHENFNWVSHTGAETLDINQHDSEVTSDSENKKTICCQEENTRVDDEDSDGVNNKKFGGISSRPDHDGFQIKGITKTEETFSGQEETLEISIESSKSLEEIIGSIDDNIRNIYKVKDCTSLGSLTLFKAKHSQQYLLFTIGGSYYAAKVANILEIGRVPPITPVPNVPDWLTGVINLRGEILSVINLGHFLDLDDSVKNDNKRLLVVRAEGEEIVTSLVVDQINGFIQLDSAYDGNLSIIFHDKMTPYLNGIFEHDGMILGIFDLERFLQSSEICQFY